MSPTWIRSDLIDRFEVHVYEFSDGIYVVRTPNFLMDHAFGNGSDVIVLNGQAFVDDRIKRRHLEVLYHFVCALSQETPTRTFLDADPYYETSRYAPGDESIAWIALRELDDEGLLRFKIGPRENIKVEVKPDSSPAFSL
jgi:hypothetical protein